MWCPQICILRWLCCSLELDNLQLDDWVPQPPNCILPRALSLLGPVCIFSPGLGAPQEKWLHPIQLSFLRVYHRTHVISQYVLNQSISRSQSSHNPWQIHSWAWSRYLPLWGTLTPDSRLRWVEASQTWPDNGETPKASGTSQRSDPGTQIMQFSFQ